MQMLYAFGSNGSGQLGVGHTEDLSKPSPTYGSSDTVHGSIKQLVAGGNHTVILYEDGVLKATGNNEDGRCGIIGVRECATFLNVERPIDDKRTSLKVKWVAATWSTTTVLCNNGLLYVCGTGNSGELGLGTGIESAPFWRQILSFPPEGTEIVDLAASMAHTVVVLSNGDVYGWGRGRKGQLGEPAEDVWSPRKINGIEFAYSSEYDKAAKAVCGKDFTLVITDPGAGRVAILGCGDSDRFNIKAHARTAFTGYKFIEASWSTIFAFSIMGDGMSWGRNDHGQWGPPVAPEIESLAAGSEHALAVTKTGKVLAWGWGEHGNCGLPVDDRGDVKERANEIDVPGRVTKVFAGCATSFVLTQGDQPGD